MSTDKELMLSGQWYNPNADDLLNERTITRTRLQKHNLTIASDFAGRDAQIRQIIGKAGANIRVEQPFWCDYGYNIEIGDNFYSDFGLTILDSANVKIGNNVKIGPNCNIYTSAYPKEVDRRNQGIQQALPISIGDNAWIGGNVTILPGVSIGKNAIVGAGSVIVDNGPSNTTYAGIPARQISTSYDDIWAIIFNISRWALENPTKHIGTSLLQRKYRIGYGKAALVIDTMIDNKIAKRDDKNHTIDIAIKSLSEIKVPEGVELDPDIINSSEDDKTEDIVIEAVRVALRKNTKYLTTAFLQRNLHIGYGRAASIIDYLVDMDLVSDHQNGKGYEITVKSEKELDDFLKKNSK